MPIYRVRRHVVYQPGCGETQEVWGIDRPAAGLRYTTAPRDTDRDDPLLGSQGDCCGGGNCCTLLLQMRNGAWVSWHRMWDWLSEAEEAGYELISGYKEISPYSTLIIRGP